MIKPTRDEYKFMLDSEFQLQPQNKKKNIFNFTMLYLNEEIGQYKDINHTKNVIEMEFK